MLAGIRGPAVVVDDDGWIAVSRGVRLKSRLSVPGEGRVTRVPGIGPCAAQRLDHGWLLLPTSHRREATQLHLVLGTEPVLEVAGVADTWRCRLSSRHAQIVMLLQAAGSQGMTAAALSRALFGEDDHLVTVRAEVSRLRRIMGEFILGNPYRLSTEVTVSIVER